MAHDAVLDRDVALKTLRPGGDERAAERLLREARVGAALEHPGIVPVYDAGTDPDGAPWVAMRVVRGRTLEAILGDAPDDAARLALVRRLHAIAEAVAYAHQRGVVHGDLKPANIMFGEHGEAQVLDWGLARDSPMGDADRHRSPVGTPAYMSPEQARLLDAPVDARTDVWSLGAVLFELLTGRRLLTGHGDSALDELTRGAPDLSALRAAPTEVAAIARRALAWRPEDRYPSAEELARDLGHFLDDRLVEAHPYSILDLLGRFVRRRRVPLAVAAVGAIALVVALARGQRLEDVQRAQLLAELAAGKTQAGERVAAARLALDALDLAEAPKARGVLAATLAGASPALAESVTLPEGCDALGMSPTGDALACRDGAGTLTVYDFPALSPRWHQTVGTYAGVALTERWMMIGPLPNAEDGRSYPVNLVDLDDGRVLAALDHETRGHPGARADAVVYRGRVSTLIARGDAPTLHVNAWCGRATATGVSVSGDRLVIACADEASSVWTGRPGGAPERLPLTLADRDWATAFAFDGDGLLVGSRTGRVWRAASSGEVRGPVYALNDGPVAALVEGEGQVVVITDNALWLWHVGAGAPERFPPEARRLLAVAPGGAWTTDGVRASRWELPPPRAARLLLADGLSALTTTDTGGVLAGDGTGCFTVYDAAGRTLYRRCDPGQVVKTVGYLPRSGVAIAERLERDRVMRYDLARGEALPDRPIRSSPKRVATMADDSFYTIHYGATVLRHDDDGDAVVQQLDGVGADLGAAPDRTWAVALDTTGSVYVLRGTTSQRAFVAPDAGVVAAGVSGEIVTGADGHLERRAVGGAVLARATFGEALDDVAVDLRGRVASGHRDGTVRVWSRELGLLSELRGHRERAALVAFGPDETLWSAGWDAVIRRWDLSALDTEPEALRDALEARWGPPR